MFRSSYKDSNKTASLLNANVRKKKKFFSFIMNIYDISYVELYDNENWHVDDNYTFINKNIPAELVKAIPRLPSTTQVNLV